MSNLHRWLVQVLIAAVSTQAALAADMTMTPAAGSGFVVKDASGVNERLRVQESGAITLPAVPSAAAQPTGVCMSGTGLLGPCSGGSGGGPAYTAATGLSLNGTTFSVAPTYQLPQTCTANQIAQWNGTAWACASASGAALPGGTNNQTLRYNDSNALAATSELQVFADGGVLATDAAVNAVLANNNAQPGPGTIPATGAGARLMWYPSKSAFRVGYDGAGAWNDDVIGMHSIAMGRNTTASGYASTAMGQGNATGDYSTAMGSLAAAHGFASMATGRNTYAGGDYSTAMGVETNARSYGSTAMGGGTSAGCDTGIVPNCDPTASSQTAMGRNTTASGDASTAMGYQTNAIGAFSTAMGSGTTAGYGSTAMGSGTTASGLYSTAMGYQTNAIGDNSTAMGVNTTAVGDNSTAMGNNASTLDANTSDPTNEAYWHSNSFVYGDGSAKTTSTASQQFMVRASGGIVFYTATDTTTGIQLPAGSGSWTNLSDRNAKDAVQPVDARDVLARVVAMPVNTWRYKTQDEKYRHMGPMAQDFYGAFHLGESDKGIDTIDASGVVLAAIQGLNSKLEAELAQLKQANAAKDAEIAALRTRVVALESAQGDLAEIKRQLAALQRATTVPHTVEVALRQ